MASLILLIRFFPSLANLWNVLTHNRLSHRQRERVCVRCDLEGTHAPPRVPCRAPRGRGDRSFSLRVGVRGATFSWQAEERPQALKLEIPGRPAVAEPRSSWGCVCACFLQMQRTDGHASVVGAASPCLLRRPRPAPGVHPRFVLGAPWGSFEAPGSPVPAARGGRPGEEKARGALDIKSPWELGQLSRPPPRSAAAACGEAEGRGQAGAHIPRGPRGFRRGRTCPSQPSLSSSSSDWLLSTGTQPLSPGGAGV